MPKNRYITLPNGEKAEVTEEIYREYMRPVWREKKRRKRRYETEVSYESLTQNGIENLDWNQYQLTEQIVEDRLMLELLMSALADLTEDERELINEIYFQEKTEREIARRKAVSNGAIHKRKEKILKKLKKYFKNFKFLLYLTNISCYNIGDFCLRIWIKQKAIGEGPIRLF